MSAQLQTVLAPTQPIGVHGRIHELFNLCNLVMVSIESYIWLAALSINAEAKKDEQTRLLYLNFMQQTIRILNHAQERLEVINGRDWSNLTQKYWMLPSYRALGAGGQRLPALLKAINEHWKAVEKAKQKVLSVDPQFGAQIDGMCANVKPLYELWKGCINDVRYLDQNSE